MPDVMTEPPKHAMAGSNRDFDFYWSGLEQQRLLIAQALVAEPELLILDEPSDGLDPEGIHEMRLTILRLQKELGLTILLSSHLLNEVEQLCTRIAVMNQGLKVFEGTLAEAKSTKQWVRLKVSDFAAASREW